MIEIIWTTEDDGSEENEDGGVGECSRETGDAVSLGEVETLGGDVGDIGRDVTVILTGGVDVGSVISEFAVSITTTASSALLVLFLASDPPVAPASSNVLSDAAVTVAT